MPRQFENMEQPTRDRIRANKRHKACRCRKPRLLVAEGDPAVRGMLVMVFRRAGWDVLAAADGKEAMRLFHGSPDIDLVILDVEMSNGHATKIFRQMRRTRPALPGLCVTSGMNQETSEELRAAGIRATFHKPFKLHTLIQEATAALDVSRS